MAGTVASDLFEWPKESPAARGLRALEEAMLCPICSEFMDNAHSLPCGHTYCSICIRKHFDRKLNIVSYDQCPSCREKSEVAQLKCNKQIQSVILAFMAARTDLLSLVRYAATHKIEQTIASEAAGPTNKKARITALGLAANSDSAAPVRDEVQRLVPKDLYKWPKEKIKKEIRDTCARASGTVIFSAQ
jgi:hypothetical protein